MERNWYEFVEYNDWEGETWRFYVNLTNEEFIYLNHLIDGEIIDIDDTSNYKLLPKKLTEAYVDYMVNDKQYGWHWSHNKVIGFKKPLLDITLADLKMRPLFYKGGNWILSSDFE